MRYPYYYLAYKAPREALKRVQIAKGLSSLGCNRLHFSFWRVPEKRIRSAFEVVKGNRPIVFRRSRELMLPHVDEEKGVYELGSVAVLVYRVPKNLTDKRAIVIRALKRTPNIQIGQSLYVLPHLKTSKLNPFKGSFLFLNELLNLLREKDIEVNCLHYLRIVYPRSHETLVRQLINTQVQSCKKLAFFSKRLADRIRRAKPPDLPKIMKTISAYRARYREIKGVAFFVYHAMNIDLRFYLKKCYNLLALCKRLVDERVSKFSSVTEGT